jgi:hypothetical protein
MKNRDMIRLFFAAMLTIPVFGLAQTAAGPQFTITGQVKGLTENLAVFVTDGSNPTDTVAQSAVKAGKFVLTGHLTEPNIYEVNFGSSKTKTPLFIGNDKIVLTGSFDDLKEIKATGSPSNDDFVEFQALFNPYFARLSVAMRMLNDPGNAKNKDSLFHVYKGITDSIFIALDGFIQKKPSSYVSAAFAFRDGAARLLWSVPAKATG